MGIFSRSKNKYDYLRHYNHNSLTCVEAKINDFACCDTLEIETLYVGTRPIDPQGQPYSISWQ